MENDAASITEGEEMIRLTKAAQAYRETRLADANGQAARFGPLSAEFERNGAITAERLRAETIEQIMARAKKVQVAGGADLRLTAPTPGAPGAQP